MLRFKKIIYGLIGILALIGAVFFIKDFFDIDECLDNDGRWNKITRSCEDCPKRNFEMKIEI